MQEHPQEDRDREATLQIDTPVIHMQDLEHRPVRETRVNNAGVRVRAQRDEPHISDDPLAEIPEMRDEQALPDDPMFAREDEKARDAVAEFEESLKRLPPD